jgi:outer membrane biosynthesis protein TonB
VWLIRNIYLDLKRRQNPMKNINDKTKGRLIVSGGLIISLILIVLISGQFRKEPIAEAELPNQSEDSVDIILETPEMTEKEDEIIVPEIEITDIETKDNGAIDTGTEQTIQGNPEKPKEPTKEQLEDPTQKPNGEKVETPPEPVNHNKVEKPAETPKKDDEPQGGDTNNGKIYVPGFGWIDDVGEGQGTTAEDMYENGNKIGNMN